jgi:hypothetical protein
MYVVGNGHSLHGIVLGSQGIQEQKIEIGLLSHHLQTSTQE